MEQKEVILGAPRRKVYESGLTTRFPNAAEDTEGLLSLQLSSTPMFLHRKYTITCVIIHTKINNFFLPLVILSVQVAVRYIQ